MPHALYKQMFAKIEELIFKKLSLFFQNLHEEFEEPDMVDPIVDDVVGVVGVVVIAFRK